MDRSTNYSALAGAITTILVWILGELGVEVPQLVSGAILVVVMTLVTHLVPDTKPPAP